MKSTIKSFGQFTFKVIFLLSIFVISFSNVNAQIDNSPFYRTQKIDTANEHNLLLSLSLLSFNKDNEYFNKIADGYTLFGNQLSTSLLYFPAKNVCLEGGVYFRKDFGNNNFSEVAPIMSVKIKHGDIKLIFGTLEGSLNHRLVEPLYDFERIMMDRQENGLQILYNKKKFDLDFWINWENMLYKGDSTQEKVSGGVSTSYKIINNPTFKLSVPVQFTAMHLGGQFDTSTLPLTSKLNGSVGLKIEKEYNRDFIKGISFEPHYLIYDDFSFEKQDVYNSGSGLYLNFTIKTKLNSIMISYWEGNKFISTHGGQLYYSRSTAYKYPWYNEPNRRLLMVRFLTDFKVFNDLHVTSRFEPFYDFKRKEVEFSLGLYINYNDLFFLKKLDPKQF